MALQQEHPNPQIAFTLAFSSISKLYPICPTCDDEFAGGGAQLGLPGQPVLGAALVGLEPVVRGHIADLQLARGQHHVLPI